MNKTNSKILNTELWQLVKMIADKVYKKPSAYKSGYMVKLYKRLGGEFAGTKNKKKGLTRWFAEDWTNQRGQVGYKYKSDIYRPQKIISDETPTTYKELTQKQIKTARRKKAETGRVNKF